MISAMAGFERVESVEPLLSRTDEQRESVILAASGMN
jgi:hypothetical protein